MELVDEEKKLEEKCQIVQDKMMMQNIFFIFNKTPNKKYSEYNINISIPKNDSPNSKEYYEFILSINLTKKSFILFSKDINPISDGRNLLPIINLNKSKRIKYNYTSLTDIDLLEIMKNLNQFILSKNFLNLYGFFYLGEEYDPKILDNLENIETINCDHLDSINGEKIEISSICTISDEFFCLYEKEQSNYTLVFYSCIKNLLSFNKTADSIVTLNWRKKVAIKKEEAIYCIYPLKIKSDNDEDMDKVMDILIEKIKKIGFKMNINEKKRGEIPNIDIETVEGEIIRLESQLKNRENILVFNKLIQNYEKVIEYYSALNDEKYIEYNNKMKDLLSNEKYSKYIK